MICHACGCDIPSGNRPGGAPAESLSRTAPQDHPGNRGHEPVPAVAPGPVAADPAICPLCGGPVQPTAERTRPPRRRLFPKDPGAPVKPGDPRQDLAIHFDIDKLASASYGEAAWRVFWTIIDLRDLPPFTTFHEGDTDWTLEQNGIDNTYCIRVRCGRPHVLAAIRDAFWDSPVYADPRRGVKALWPFQVDEDAARQPLVEAGHVSYDHELKGACHLARPALEAVERMPVDLDILFQEAMGAYRSSQPRHDPDSLGLPRFDEARLRAAHDGFRELLASRPLDIEALLMRAQCAHDLDDPDIGTALGDVETVLRLHPSEARAHDLLAGLLYRKFIGDDEKKANELALLNFKKVLEINPDYSSDTGYRLATRTNTNRAFRENIAGHEKALADLARRRSAG